MTATDWSDLTFAGVLFAGLGMGILVTLRVGKIIADYFKVQKPSGAARDPHAPDDRGDR